MKNNNLYRAKRKDKDSWIYGYYSEIEFCDGNGRGSYIKMDGYAPIEVLPETVGQHIGLKGYEGEYNDRHKNEVQLFEGDIVEAWSEGSKGTFVIKWRQECSPCFMLYPAWQNGKMFSIYATDIGREKGDYFDDLKRIGNIHDNPELVVK